jgi:hypothetical protein
LPDARRPEIPLTDRRQYDNRSRLPRDNGAPHILLRYDLEIALLRITALPRPNWSRPLPRPVVIPKVLTLATLADVRMLLEMHLPPEQRERSTWLHVKNPLHGAARGEDDPGEIEIALRMVLSIDGVGCRPPQGNESPDAR